MKKKGANPAKVSKTGVGGGNTTHAGGGLGGGGGGAKNTHRVKRKKRQAGGRQMKGGGDCRAPGGRGGGVQRSLGWGRKKKEEKHTQKRSREPAHRKVGGRKKGQTRGFGRRLRRVARARARTHTHEKTRAAPRVGKSGLGGVCASWMMVGGGGGRRGRVHKKERQGGTTRHPRLPRSCGQRARASASPPPRCVHIPLVSPRSCPWRAPRPCACVVAGAAAVVWRKKL